MRAVSRFTSAVVALALMACSSDSTAPQNGGGNTNGGNGGNNGGGTPIAVARVSIAPETSFVYLGRTLGMQATPRDANGNALSGRAITWPASLMSKYFAPQLGML